MRRVALVRQPGDSRYRHLKVLPGVLRGLLTTSTRHPGLNLPGRYHSPPRRTGFEIAPAADGLRLPVAETPRRRSNWPPKRAGRPRRSAASIIISFAGAGGVSGVKLYRGGRREFADGAASWVGSCSVAGAADTAARKAPALGRMTTRSLGELRPASRFAGGAVPRAATSCGYASRALQHSGD